ncbi:methyltransferase, FkbM family [Polaromonas sp. YR568]|uniref:FkbM family methyltransferase n=1 Tax=Polaromonas sp. YR568 TaxID=1855301 RepID=UPI0008E12341|nr:FkbM family methyltransferase [Polaromonas sp. YR568]SFU85962.1 methyltransferase, FkbM family [Polaromonas sp. YR568]
MSKPADFIQRHINRFSNEPAIEQQLVQEFFKGGLGFYVDVGANDPVLDSQSQHLEVLGWTGLLVEPDPDCCELLRQNRKGVVIEMACSSPENAGKYLQLNRAGPHSTLEDRPIALGAVVRSTVQVRCETLDTMLRTHGAPVGFDLLSVDIEGHELVALSGFDFAYWQPRLVLIEDHVTHHQKHALMRRNGYQLILRTGLNSWYVPAKASYTFSWAARFEYLRKYYLGLPTRKWRYSRPATTMDTGNA